MRTNTSFDRRSGLSLLEIIAATMILLIGVLGTISAIRLGVFQTSRVKIADTSAACGRAALRQIRMADWQKSNGISSQMLYPYNNNLNDPYIVDPLGFYDYATGGPDASNRSVFPIGSGGNILNRYSFYSESGADYRSIAFRDFFWQDDITYDIPSATMRPQMMNRKAGYGEPGYDTSITTNDPTDPDRIQASAEQFSWMFMVTPFVDSTGNSLPLCEVSAVVFYQRGDAIDGERACDGWFNSTIYPQDNSPNGELTIRADSEESLDLSTIRYVLVVDTNSNPTVVKWYRIISDGKIVDSSDTNYTFERTMFITGPAWPQQPFDTNGDPIRYDVVLCDGVVGVYTETMPR